MKYTPPTVRVMEFSPANHILNGSLGGSPSNKDWENGSGSQYDFGDEN